MINELKVPEFKSSVPEILRHRMGERELNVWVADQLSIQTQTLNWIGEQLVETRKMAAESAETIHRWKSRIVDPVSIVIAGIVFLIPVVASVVALFK
jgi:hypothetical protein